MKYPVVQMFREKPKLNRYDIGDVYETDDPDRAEHLQKEGYIGSKIEDEKPKAPRGKRIKDVKESLDKVGEETSKSGAEIADAMKKLSGGDANESSKAESKDSPAEAE